MIDAGKEPYRSIRCQQSRAKKVYTEGMRLTSGLVRAILSVCTSKLDYTPGIWLFGSRLRDEARGGDIDLFIEVRDRLPLMDELHLQNDLETTLQRKVDVIISIPGHDDGPWQRLAKKQGVRLDETT